MAGRISGFDASTGELGLLFASSTGNVVNLSPYLQSDDVGAGFVVPLSLKSPSEVIGLVVSRVGYGLAANLSARRETQAVACFEAWMEEFPILRATATTVKVVP